MTEVTFIKDVETDVFVRTFPNGVIFCDIADLETGLRPTVQFKVRHFKDKTGAEDALFYNYKDALESLGIKVIENG